MHLFDVTLSTPAENLALDEALLDEAEAAPAPREVLRLWEPRTPFVVVGRNSELASEVNLAACRRRNVPVLRRTSGGCAIVAGPGSLMYALLLSYELHPELRMLDLAHRFVLGRFVEALEPLVPGVTHEGTSDLAIGTTAGILKFSGNSLRCRRNAFLYHGTLLYDFPLALLDESLSMPPRQPAYRQHRPHSTFVANLPITAADLRRATIAAWQAQPAPYDWPRARVAELVAERYSQPEWNEKR